MKVLGLEHGQRGFNKLTDEVRSTCSGSDLEQYENGFFMGWNTYCTSFNGFNIGKKGDSYKSFCPPEKEELFYEKYLIGKKVYEKKDQVSELQDKIKDLEQTAEKDSSSAIKEDLKAHQDYLLTLKREIQALEQKGMSLVHTN